MFIPLDALDHFEIVVGRAIWGAGRGHFKIDDRAPRANSAHPSLARCSHRRRSVRINNLAATLVLALSCALSSASCVQGAESSVDTSGAGAGAPGLDADEGIESAQGCVGSARLAAIEEANAGVPGLLALCLALTPASVPSKEEFCRSLPEAGTRARCWRYRFSRLEWAGWCYFEFSD